MSRYYDDSESESASRYDDDNNDYEDEYSDDYNDQSNDDSRYDDQDDNNDYEDEYSNDDSRYDDRDDSQYSDQSNDDSRYSDRDNSQYSDSQDDRSAGGSTVTYTEEDRSEELIFSDLPIPSERDGYLNPDMEGYYRILITYPSGNKVEIRRVVINQVIVLDDGDIIRLNDKATTGLLNRLKLSGLNVQEYTHVRVMIAGIEYPGYQYTPTESPYNISLRIPPYDKKQMLELRRDIRRAINIDLGAIHWGVRWDGRYYRYFGRISGSTSPSQYMIQIDLFTTYINHIYTNKLTRPELAEIQAYLLS